MSCERSRVVVSAIWSRQFADWGDRVTESDLRDAADLAATWGQDLILDELISCGLPLGYMDELLEVAERHQRQWATSALRAYRNLRIAEESLKSGDEGPALNVLTEVFSPSNHRRDRMRRARRQTVATRRVLQRGLSPSATRNGEPLFIAVVRCGLVELTRELLLAGVDPHTPSKSGRLALDLCESLPIAECLLHHGANPVRPNQHGFSALAIKAFEGPADVFELLLHRCPEAEVRNLDRLPPVTGIHDPKISGGDLIHTWGQFDRRGVQRLLSLGARWPMH